MNMGTADRVVRAVIGIVLLVIAFLVLQGAWQIVLWILGAIMLITAATGICPLYYPLHISTKKQA